MKIGFAILTHTNSAQTFRLIGTLNKLFNNPPIALHHDFSKSPLNTQFTDNVFTIKPHEKTSWGGIGIIRASMLAFNHLYNSHDPDWYYLLSNSCYPIKSASTIMSDLRRTKADAHISHVLIDRVSIQNAWQQLCFDRYISARGLPKFVKRNPLITSIISPFRKDFHCWAGEFWFTANRKSIKQIIHSYQKNGRLINHYKNRLNVDESYFHTILLNNNNLIVSNNNFRYIDWSQGGDHPKTLSAEDAQKISSSTAHFARKFNSDKGHSILDWIDENILK